jgi:hypothetical protein
MRLTTDYTALFTPFELAGKRLRNRIAHASMTTLSTPVGRVTERLIQYHANRASGGAALTVTEPLGMMRHQAGLPRVQVWRRDDADGLKRFAEAVECQDCRLLGQIQDAGRGRQAIRAKERGRKQCVRLSAESRGEAKTMLVSALQEYRLGLSQPRDAPSGVASRRFSRHVRPAVHVEDLAGNGTGILRSEEHGRSCNLIGRQHLAAERNDARHLDQLGIGVAIPRLGRVGHAGRYGVDANVVRGELERHGTGHRDHAALARAVVHAAYGAADRLRGNVDHGAAALAGRHQRLDVSDGGKAASLEVDIEHVVPVGLAHLEQLHPRIDTGVVDQNVGRAQYIGGIGHHHVDVGQPRYIGADEVDTATDLAPLFRRDRHGNQQL